MYILDVTFAIRFTVHRIKHQRNVLAIYKSTAARQTVFTKNRQFSLIATTRYKIPNYLFVRRPDARINSKETGSYFLFGRV